jgi:hypothetical protein
MKYLQLKFYLSSGLILESIVQDDGLSAADFRNTIEETINDDGTYTLLNIVNEEWIIIQGNRIDAFGIIDLGENYLTEGFDIK